MSDKALRRAKQRIKEQRTRMHATVQPSRGDRNKRAWRMVRELKGTNG